MIEDPRQKGQSDILLSPGTLKEQLSIFTEEQLQQIVQQANQWAAFVRQMQWMDNVSKEMKVVAELPSEVVTQKDTNPLVKIDYPEEGGVLTYMENFKYPFRGYPHHEFVEKIDSIKKFSRQLMSGFYHQLKNASKIRLVTLIPALWIMKTGLRAYVYVIHRIVERFLIKPERHCQFVRELYRAFSLERSGESESEREFRLHLRDATCMILEFDNAYRFRAQDILAELDKGRLIRDTSGELIRLLELMSSREKQQEVRDTWRLFRIGIRFYLNFDRKLKRLIQHVFTQLDLEKVKLTVEDKEYCMPRKDYIFGCKLKPAPEDEEIIKIWEVKSKWQEERDEIWKESNETHQALFQAQKREMDDLIAKTPKIPEEEKKATEAEMQKIAKEYNDELQNSVAAIQKELQQKYEPRHNKIAKRLSNQEINILSQKHLEERQILDKKYTELLNKAEERYQESKKN